jgi:hypothetical protein
MVANATMTHDTPRQRFDTAGTSCTVRIDNLSDDRSSPEMLGVVQGRAVYAPADRTGWLRSILSGLESRGVPVRFMDEQAAEPLIRSRISLKTAWMTNIASNISATVVIHVRAEGTGHASLDQSYRASSSRMIFWAGISDAELQKGLDGAFSDALDDMAEDMRRLCAAG